LANSSRPEIDAIPQSAPLFLDLSQRGTASLSSLSTKSDIQTPTTTPSGDDANETFVQFPLVVEDRLPDLIHRPHPLRIVGIIDESAREDLIAVPRWIEEVDRLASRDTVSGRADVEWNVV